MSIRRNTFYNLGGALVPTAVTIFTVPLYLHLIGVERYGVLAIVWALLGYFGVFDLGLGRATARKIATLRHGDPGERSETFWTALILNVVFGVVGGILILPIAKIAFTSHFQIAEPLRREILSAVPWFAAVVPVSTISGVLTGALQGRERFLALNASSMLGTVLYQLFPLCVAWIYGPDLASLVPAVLFGQVATLLVLFTQCYLYVPLNMTPSVKRDLVVPLFRYGGWVTVTSFVAPLLTTLDRFLIGSIVGAKGVTYYTVPYNLASRVNVLPGSLSDTLFPRFSATSDEERHHLMDKAVRSLSVILTPLIIAGILIMEPFLKWWVGADVTRDAAFVGEIIALGVWFNGLAYIPFARLQAQGRPDLVAKCHLAEIIPYLAFLFLALRAWGVIGAAVAWSLRVFADAILLFWIGGVAPRYFKAHLIPLVLLGMAAAAVFAFPLGSVSRWAVGGGTLLGSLVWAWWKAPDSVKGIVLDCYHMLPRARKA
jgi:O-antigen/teichoic acid export membrane protein